MNFYRIVTYVVVNFFVSNELLELTKLVEV